MKVKFKELHTEPDTKQVKDAHVAAAAADNDFVCSSQEPCEQRFA